MAWLIKFDDAAAKELKKLDKPVASRISAFLRERVSVLENPRALGEALKGAKFGEFWKYRVGDYRIIAKIEDEALIILVVRIGNRKQVYKT